MLLVAVYMDLKVQRVEDDGSKGSTTLAAAAAQLSRALNLQ